MNVNQTYEVMQYAVAKNIQQGYLSPDDFYTVINTAQRSYLDYLLGQYQRYQLKRPVAPVEFGLNQRIRQSIVPLIYGTILTVNSQGVAAYPSDYEYTDAMWDVYNIYNIRFIQQDRQDAWVHSSIDPVVSNPVYLINHEGFQFYPNGIGQAKMSYVRTPPSIVWGYTVDGNGVPVWNPATSQNPVWSESDMMQIIVRALALVGVSLQASVVSQYAEQIKQSGQ